MPRKRDMKRQTQWSRVYNASAYDRLYSVVPRGHKGEIQAAADSVGESLNKFIATAIDERIAKISKNGIDNSKK